MATTLTPDDLATFLGVEMDPEDVTRAQMILDLLLAQALSIVTVGNPDPGMATAANLPDGAEGVIYGAAGRALYRTFGDTQEVAGSFSRAGSAGSGSMLSSAEKRALQALAGRSSAFSIDLLASSGFGTL